MYFGISSSHLSQGWRTLNHIEDRNIARVPARLLGSSSTSTYVSIRQHTSAYISIRQHTSAYVSIRLLICQHTSAYDSIRQNTSARTSAYVSAYLECSNLSTRVLEGRRIRQHTSAYVSAYVSIRQHTSAYVSILQYTSAYACSDRRVETIIFLLWSSLRITSSTVVLRTLRSTKSYASGV